MRSLFGRRDFLKLSALSLGALPATAWGSAAAFSSRLLAPDPVWQASRGARSATGISGICGAAAGALCAAA